MNAATLLIRADASVAIGTGHVMRCLALAQAWQDAGGRAVFAMAESTPAIHARLTRESCGIANILSEAGTAADANQTAAFAKEQRSDWVVVDGYHFSTDYQRVLRAAGLKVVFLDDNGHAGHYSADLVLNQGVSASADLYVDREPTTRLLVGTRYCLLRREFALWRNRKKEIPRECRRVLAMMGGSDPENLTVRVIHALESARLSDIKATVIVGGSNPNAAQVRSVAAHSVHRVTVQEDASNVAELMAKADVAISAAGSTCWELCFMGLPALLIDVADNQTELANELDRLGCAIRVGDRTALPENISNQLKRVVRSQALRQSLSNRSRVLVDGNGAARVVSVLLGTELVRLRRVRAEDARLLWEWANDSEVRSASFSSEPISWETHLAWFEKTMVAKNVLLFVAEDKDGMPVGQIRFELIGDEADLNLSVAKEKRGIGLAVPLIEAGISELFATVECKRVHAFVKPQNVASLTAFERAGFARIGMKQVRGNTAVHFTYARN